MRSEFEKLPEIADKLHTVYFDEQFNTYFATMVNSSESVKFVQGAWMAYQEQQKRIDAVLNIIAQSELHCDRSVFGLQDEIKELLK